VTADLDVPPAAGSGGDRTPPRHGHRAARGFGAALGLTVLGALVPGTAFLAAGRRKLGAVTLVLFLLLVGAGVGRDTTGQRAAVPGNVVDRYAFAVGADEAPVVVDVYEDFMCPFCGQFEAATRQQLQGAVDAGRAQVQYHVLNFLDGASKSEYSTRSANALAVVLDTSGPEVAKKFHDQLFEHQPQEGSAGLSDAELLDLAVQAGADRAAVSAGIKDRTFEGWVDNVTNQASKDGVNSTPTVMIDGKTVDFKTIGELVAAVEKATSAQQ